MSFIYRLEVGEAKSQIALIQLNWRPFQIWLFYNILPIYFTAQSPGKGRAFLKNGSIYPFSAK